MAIEYNFTLDMDRSKRDNNIAYARTGDVDSITINADLVLNGAAYTPSGTNAFFECITPNGHSIRAVAEKSGSSVSVDVPSAAFQAAGVINVAYFRFETGNADNPTYIESTEPFAIVVREGIGDNIDAGDYIEEWRGLVDQLEAVVAEVEQKAEQAETAINEQKTEVDQLKAQVQTSMAQDVEDVSDAKDTAISNINSSQVAVDAAIEQLEQKTQEAVDATQDALDGTLAANLQNAINRTLKLDVADMTNIPNNASLSSYTTVGSYCCKTASAAATISDSPVDDGPFNLYVFSSAASGQVMQLVVPIDIQGKPTAEWYVRFGTSSATDPWSVIGGGADIAAGLGIDVTGDAQKTVSLDTTSFYQHHEATDIIQGSTEVTGGGRIKELKVYGNTRQNLWVDDDAVLQFGGVTVTKNSDGSVTASGESTVTSDRGSVYDVNVHSLCPGSSYVLSIDKYSGKCVPYIQFYTADGEPASGSMQTIAAGSVSKPFTVDSDWVYCRMGFLARETGAASGTYRVMLNEGSTDQPWCPPGLNGVDELEVVCAGKNLSEIGEYNGANFQLVSSNLPPGTYTLSGVAASNFKFNLVKGTNSRDEKIVTNASFPTTFTLDASAPLFVNGYASTAITDIQLELGTAATDYEPPQVTTIPIDLDGHALNSLPDGTRDELTVDATGAVTLVQRVGVATAPMDAGSWFWQTTYDRAYFTLPANSSNGGLWDQRDLIRCDKLPVVESNSDATYTLIIERTAYAKNPTITSAATAAAVAGGATYLYPLATPKTIELPSVTLPELASPAYTVFANSDIQAEIEADVVKVDYLPASDVYTKEEVDKKIEDAGSMPDVVPVSQGGTGVTTAAAERNRLGLGNTTGAVPVANGGTGSTSSKAAQNAILNDMNVSSDAMTDSSMIVGYNVSPSASNGAVHKRSVTTLWDYIVTKIRSAFGFNTSNVLDAEHGGTGATSVANARTNLSVYSKAEVDGKVPKVVYGTGNIPSDAANGTIYIQYRS